MDWHMDSIVLVARASDCVVETMGIWAGITVLLLLECKEIVRSHALYDVRSTRSLD